MKHEDKFSGETAVSVFNSCIKLCDVIISGKENAIGLKYDEENMFAPMVVFLERDKSAEAILWAALNLGVPVIKNIILAKNLESYSKAGDVIPESTYRDVSLALTRVDGRPARRAPGFGKNRQSIPIRIPRPLTLELGETLFVLTGEEPGREALLTGPLDKIRKKLVRLLGIRLPSFRISRSKKLKGGEYRILFRGLEAGRGRLDLGWYLATPDIMNDPENILAAAKAAALALVHHVDEIIQVRAPEFLGRDEVEAILEAAEEKYPVVTGEVKGLLSLGIIREILQSLVSEQVAIRHIAVILETLADWGSFGPVPNDLIVERIRQSLKRQICLEYADDRLTLRVLTLEPKLEKRFVELQAGQVNQRFVLGDRVHLPDNSAGEDLADYISSSVRVMEEKGFPPVILCSPKARSAVKETTRRKHPNLAVLSYLEIPSDISVLPMGEIRIEENTRQPGLLNEQ